MTDAEARTNHQSRSENDKPAAYWIVKIVMGLAVAALEGFALFTEQSVNPVVITTLGVVASGPEFVAYLRPGPGPR